MIKTLLLAVGIVVDLALIRVTWWEYRLQRNIRKFM